MPPLTRISVTSLLALSVLAGGVSYAAPPAPPFLGGNINISREAPVQSEDDANPAVAYNATNDLYLVVWWGDTATTGLNNFEVFGRLVGGRGGTAGLPAPFRISFTGPSNIVEGDPLIAREPDVTYNPSTGEYLVVWFAHTGAAGDIEVFGQRVTPFGTLAGTNFLVSDTNTVNPAGNALYPSVTQAGDAGYIAVWQADGTPVDQEFEIFGRRIAADGTTPSPSFRVSTQGVDGDITTEAIRPDVAYRSGSDQLLVVWQGDVSGADDFEVFGQLIDPNGVLLGGRFPVSVPNPASVAERPVVVHNSVTNGFLAVWRDNAGSQILGRVLEATGFRPAGANLAISAPGEAPTVGSASDNGIGATHNPRNNHYLVNWPGSVKGRIVRADGGVPGTVEDFSNQIGNLSVDVTYNSTAHEYFTVFDADGGTRDKVVYGQRRAAPPPPATVPQNPAVTPR